MISTALSLLVGGAIAGAGGGSVALCEGDTYYDCHLLCGGTLVAPNLVVTSRHCADPTRIDSLDCASYRFSGQTKAPSTIWVTAASPISNGATFHQGTRWGLPRPLGCGHDLAFLTLGDAMPEVAPAAPAIAHDAVATLGASELQVVGYGRSGPGGALDGVRRHAPAHVLCLGGRDACTTVPGGRELLPTELAVDVQVCGGDSGSGVMAPDGALLGALARTIGGSSECAYGVYTRLDPHALLLARSARSAATAGGYAPAPWVEGLTAGGNGGGVAPRAFGASCDDDVDCASGACRTYDGGLAWSCARTCDGSCRCRDGFCFAEPATPDDGGCRAARGPAADGALAFALALALVRRARRA